MNYATILQGDCRDVLKTLPDKSFQCCVTSPPYWGLRDYGCAGQIGLEKTPGEYVAALVGVFHEVKRVMRDDGTLWLNLGDSYARAGGYSNNNGLDGVTREECQRARSNAPNGVASQKLAGGMKSKDLCGIPWRVAFAMQADGWYLRSDIIWHKPNPMPESVTDRPTRAHEYIFLMTKSERYFYDAAAIREPASYGEEHANKTTSWGPNGKMAANKIGKSNREDYQFKGDNHTSHVRTKNCQPKGLTNHSFHENREDGNADEVYYERNKRDVWTVATSPYPEAHFATFPTVLIKPCVLAGSKVGDSVLDPFLGSGCTAEVATELGRKCTGIELNPEYVKLANDRSNVTAGML